MNGLRSEEEFSFGCYIKICTPTNYILVYSTENQKKEVVVFGVWYTCLGGAVQPPCSPPGDL